VSFWDITQRNPFKSTDFLEEHITFIVRVEQTEQDTSVKAGGKPSKWHKGKVTFRLVVSQSVLLSPIWGS
jgi:hypothetical protein